MVRCGRERDLCSCGDGVCGAGCGGVGGKFGGEIGGRLWLGNGPQRSLCCKKHRLMGQQQWWQVAHSMK